jgi:hypothetical protein
MERYSDVEGQHERDFLFLAWLSSGRRIWYLYFELFPFARASN